MTLQRHRRGVWLLLFVIACAQLSSLVAKSSNMSVRNGTTDGGGHSRQRRLVSTEKFNWKDYLYYNKDLTATGITTEAAAVSHFVSSGHKEGRRYNKVMPGMEDFDWRAYLQLNADLYKAGLVTEMQAYGHYVAAGKREGRHSNTAKPLMSSLEDGINKLNTYIRLKRDLEDIVFERSNFVLYHLEDIESSSNSIAVTFNNVKLFASSIHFNNMDVFAAQNAFYWINVASINYNPLAELFPTNNPNVVLVNWEIDGGEMHAHVDTLQRLSRVIAQDFSAVFFLNSGVRGPFEQRKGGEWMSPYRALLDDPNVGVVGAGLSCQPTPRIQTHFFAIKGALIPHVINCVNETYMNMEVWVSLDVFMQTGITEVARKNNYEVASMLHLKRVGTPFLRGSCYNDTRLMDHSAHLASMHEWCHVYPKEVNFVRWSGEALGAPGYACNKAIATDADSVTVMEEEVALIAKAEPKLNLELSEALIGGQLYDLYQSYTDEFWRHRNVTIMNRAALIAASEAPDLPTASSEAVSKELANAQQNSKNDSKVCFLVRTTRAQDPTINHNSKSKYGMLQMDINQHIKSLLRQSNHNWEAFYVLTEKPVFSKMLRAILNSYNDARLSLLPVDPRLLIKHDEAVVAAQAVNFALKALQRHSECRYISITSANHAYGSEVVERVLGARPVLGQPSPRQPDILLAPMDSKYFATQDYALRKEVRWDQRCLGLEAMLRHNLLGFTVQPVPHPGRVFFGSAFFSRQKMISTNYFGLNANVSTQSSSACTGSHDCQDGYFIQHLVRNRLWSYSRLALDGLKTIVFQENSPSLCVASGNVWFDYPHMSNVGCISHKTLYLLSQKDSPKSAFDWQSFHDGERVCLRLSNLGFTSRVNAARKAAVVASKPSKHKGGHHNHDGHPHRRLRVLQEAAAVPAAPAPAVPAPDAQVAPAVVAPGAVVPVPDAPVAPAAQEAAAAVAVAAQVAVTVPASPPVPVAEALAGSTAPQPVPLPEDFNWKDYLAMNPDLQAEGIIFKTAAIEHYQLVGAREGRGYHEIVAGTESFDWRAYLELTNDVPLNRRTEVGATAHYRNIGKFENHVTSHVMPDPTSWTQATKKLDTFTRKLNADKVELANRNLVLYMVEDLSNSENSIDVVVNNVRLFATSISQHGDNVKQRAFYLLNVISPHDNLLLAELPTHAPNVAVIRWNVTSSDLYTHIRTLTLLPSTVISEFSALFFTSSGVRGPLVYNKNGDWIKEFRTILDVKEVGMVGPTMSCKSTPHVQTHFFALKSALIPHILSEVQRYNALTTPWQSVLDYFTTEMSASVQRAGYQVTSRLTQMRLSPKTVDLNCTAHNNEFSIPYSPNWEYRTWCDVQPQEVIFQRWGGEAVYYPDPNEAPTDSPNAVAIAYPDRYVCAKEIDMSDHALMKMEDNMLDVASSSPQVTFVLPESPYGGLLYDLFKQYREEMWLERLNHMSTTDYHSPVARSRDPRGASPEEDSNVCFLIRTSTRDDPMRTVRAKPEMKDMDLASLIQSLLRQTNKNWQAYFFVTDLVPFENRLRRILSSYGDRRLIYFPLAYEHRPAFTKVDAGYTSTDYVMNKLKSQTECKFLSITNGDNVYGSDVVENVLHWKPSLGQTPPDMLLAPLDSRNFAEHDYNKRHESELVDRCKGIHGMLNYNLLTYTVQPIPFLGRVDLAAVFLHRRKFASENLLFGNFTNPKVYPCAGCQDGYLTQYLVRSRRWSYVRMPVDGLRSVIFHGPSPTWCVAAGNVWFDYPHVNKVGCFSHETVAYLRQNENAATPMFDWENYAEVSKLCLRLSKSGFLNKAIGN